ncbi:MAG: hypothetical protein J6I41_01115 [Bacteroidales bacterium]|nr:hypothetical protein [Bacteroidales bacterium]
MKKIIISLLLIAACFTGRAQIGTDFGVNMFMNMGGGVSMYQYADNPLHTGFSGGISVGKWILSPLAARITLDFQTLSKTEDLDANAAFASTGVEFLWDFTSTFMRIRNWRINVYPMIGLGVFLRTAHVIDGHTYGTDREVHGLLGLHVPVRISGGWSAFAQYKCYFLPTYGYLESEVATMHSITGGFTYNFTETPFHRRTEHESRSTDEDWFAGFGLGANYSSFDLFTNPHHGGLAMLGVAPEIMFGRNFSNFWTIRFEATGLTAHEKYDTVLGEAGKGYTFTMVHADLMTNLSHLFNFKRGAYWSIMPYLGAGAIWRYDDVKFDMAADFGLFLRRYISREGDLFVDLKYIMMAPRIGGSTGPSGSIYGVGLPSITVGYIHNFGHSSTRYRQPYNCAD